MQYNLNILIVEDSKTSVEHITLELKNGGIKGDIKNVDSRESLKKEIKTNHYDLIILDFILNGFTAIEAVSDIRQIDKYIPIILISGAVGEEKAVEGMKLGANDFLKKDNLSRLVPAIKREIIHTNDRIEREIAQEELKNLNHSLEKKVDERTKELKELNKSLTALLENQKKIIQKTNTTKSFLNTVLENIPSKVYVKDITTNRIIFANSEFIRFFDININDLINKQFSDFVDEISSERIEKAEKSIYNSFAENDNFQIYIGNDSSVKKNIRLKMIPIETSSDKKKFIIGVIEDLTDREIYKEKNKNLESMFFTLFRASPVPIVVTRLSDNIIVYVNEAFMKLSKYSSDELLGVSSKYVEIWADIDFRNEFVRNTIEQTGNHHNLDAQIIQKDGSIIDTIVSAEKIEIDGEDMIIFMGIDITDRKSNIIELENTLKKQKELNVIRSQFVSMISHEYRTPLTTIMLSSDLLKRYGKDWPDEERDKHFKRIQDTVLKMTQMMENVLILGNIESGKLRFNPDKFDLEAFCISIAKNIEFTTNKKIKIDLNYKAKYKDYYLDENLIGLIITNILNNAVKYSLSNDKVDFRVYCDKDKLFFEIEDYGIGIPENDVKNVFKEFFRASNTKNISGYGLGLTIVKRAVEAHKGNISVVSELDKGTKFTLEIPNCSKIIELNGENNNAYFEF